jgi:transcriptional/translational regulatory protein YebC/TACO1
VTFLAPAVDFFQVKQALEAAGIQLVASEIAYVPQTWVEVTDRDVAKRVLRLVDKLEENEDVQNVYANFDIPEEWLSELQG